MAGPAGPPGFDPHAPPPPLINQAVPLVPLLELAAEDARWVGGVKWVCPCWSWQLRMQGGWVGLSGYALAGAGS